MTVNISKRWWGELKHPLHCFDTLVDAKGATLIRTGERAACGWRPPGGILESPLEPELERECPVCRDNAKVPR